MKLVVEKLRDLQQEREGKIYDSDSQDNEELTAVSGHSAYSAKSRQSLKKRKSTVFVSKVKKVRSKKKFNNGVHTSGQQLINKTNIRFWRAFLKEDYYITYQKGQNDKPSSPKELF